jgi:hypothetical protein
MNRGCLLVAVVLVCGAGCFRFFGSNGAERTGIGSDADVLPDAAGEADLGDAEEADGDGDGEACADNPEICNGLDDDCDGVADEDFDCVLGAVEPCSYCGVAGTTQCAEGCVLTGCDAACPAETPDCCTDVCVDLTADPLHCGLCTTACAEGWLCLSGVCDDGS